MYVRSFPHVGHGSAFSTSRAGAGGVGAGGGTSFGGSTTAGGVSMRATLTGVGGGGGRRAPLPPPREPRLLRLRHGVALQFRLRGSGGLRRRLDGCRREWCGFGGRARLLRGPGGWRRLQGGR